MPPHAAATAIRRIERTMLEWPCAREADSVTHLHSVPFEGLGLGAGLQEHFMTKRTRGSPLLYAAGTSPARWLRAAAAIVDAWGSDLCAHQWHATRLVPIRVTSERAQQRAMASAARTVNRRG
jgi:hypothetical protein